MAEFHGRHFANGRLGIFRGRIHSAKRRAALADQLPDMKLRRTPLVVPTPVGEGEEPSND